MKKAGWFSRLFNQQPSFAMFLGMLVAMLLAVACIAVAQNPAEPIPTPNSTMSIPQGYSVHQSVDLGGHMAGLSGSGAMYDTLVNLQSGPRVLGETFRVACACRAPGTPRSTICTVFASGFGGDPNNFAKLDFSKGKYYEFSGMFRRDRQYFDYDLLGNPGYPQRVFHSDRAFYGANWLLCVAAGDAIAVLVQHGAPHDGHQPDPASAVEGDLPRCLLAEHLSGAELHPERQFGGRAGSPASGVPAQQHRRFYRRDRLEAGAGHQADL